VPPYHLAYIFERFPTFTQTFCVREILELERQGVRPLIFSLRDTRDEPAQSYPESLRDRVVYLPPSNDLVAQVKKWRTEQMVPKPVDYALRLWDSRPDKNRVYEAAWIGNYLQEHAPEIHHAHGHFAGMAARTMWWLRQFHGHTFSFTAHANDVFCPEPDTPVTRDLLMRDASRVVTVSDYTVRRLQKEYPVAERKIRRVYNGLDLEKWTEACAGKPKGIGSRRIYSVGRLIEKKGYDDLVRACAHLRDRGKEFSCHIIGNGPLEGELQQLIAEHGLQEQVILEGEKDQAAIIDHLANRAHLFALPCVTEADGGMDNLPTVIMEAMAVGLPCVSTRLAGVPEMVIEGKTGLLSDERQPERFAECLETLLEDEERCHQMGRAGYRLAAERFDKAVTTKALQKALISGGRVRFDPALLTGRQELYWCYLQQIGLTLGEGPRRWMGTSVKHFLGGDMGEEE